MRVNRISRRTVLRAGCLLAGATTFTGTGGADKASPLLIDVRQETLNPDENGVIPVEVTIPEGLLDPGPAFPLLPDEVFFGVGQAFETLEEGGEEYVSISDEYEDGVANPVRARSVAGHEGHWIVHFATQDLRYPEPDDWDGVLGLGVFPDGVDDFVPGDHWDTDTVKVPAEPVH